MLFKPELAIKIAKGQKTQTRRWAPHKPISAGKTFFAELRLFDTESRFALLKAVNVYEWNPLDITKAIAKAEGFDTPADFSKAFQEINAHKSMKTPSGKLRKHWAVEFKVEHLILSPTLPDALKSAIKAALEKGI